MRTGEQNDRRTPCFYRDSRMWTDPASEQEVRQAKRVCLDECPKALACRDTAAQRCEWGVWGGVLFAGGAVVVRFSPRRWAADRHEKPLVFADIAHRLHAGEDALPPDPDPDFDWDAAVAQG